MSALNKRSFVKKNKSWIRVLDILFISFLVMHFATIALTNAIVIKNEPSRQIVELNPKTAEVYNLKTVEKNEVWIKIKPVLTLFAAYLVVIGGWVYLRMTLESKRSLWVLTILTSFLFLMMATNLANDLGYFIGKVSCGR